MSKIWLHSELSKESSKLFCLLLSCHDAAHDPANLDYAQKQANKKSVPLCVCLCDPRCVFAHPADQIQGWTRWWFFASGGLSLSSTKPPF